MRSIQANTPKMRAVIIVAAVLLLMGAVFYFGGEWGPGVGRAGVASKLASACGMAVFGLSLLLLGIVFATSYTRQLSCLTLEERRNTLGTLARQTFTACLNVFVYVGIFIVAMGGIAALDAGSIGTTLVVIGVWGCCIAAFVLYRRYRKAHQAQYDLFSSLAITLLFFLFGAGMSALSVSDVGAAVQDLEGGPVDADVFLVEAKIDYPSWRYARVIQARHVLTFYTADEKRIVLEVPESDVDSAKVINDHGNFVHLAYYPRTQVFCSAERWEEGRAAMGDGLLEKLNEEYDFML